MQTTPMPSSLCAPRTVALLASALAALAIPAARAQTGLWNGGSGQWISANWTFAPVGPVYPDGPGFGAAIGSGSVGIANGEAISVDQLALSGGNLTGAGALGLTGNLTSSWSGGSLNGTGTLTIGAAHTLNIADGFTANYAGRQLLNLGVVNRTANSNLHIQGGQGSVIANQGVWNESASTYETQFNAAHGGAASFVNDASGTFRKTGNAQTTFTGVAFANNGLVDTQAGSLYLATSVSASDGAIFRTSGGANYLNNLAATGLTHFEGSANYLYSGTHALESFDGTARWIGGNFNNGGTTTVTPGGTLLIGDSFNADYNGHAFVNNGTVTHTNASNLGLRGGNGSSITNNATWNEVTSTYEGYYSAAFGGAAVFTNTATGSFVKTGNAQANFSGVPFDNAGLVDVQNGSLYLASGGSSTSVAIFRNGSGATTYYNNYLFGALTTFQGDGHYLYSGTHHLQAFDGVVRWVAGNFNASDVVTTIKPGSSLVIADGFNADYSGHAFVNNGTVTHANANNLSVRGGSGSSITNNATWNESTSTYTGYYNNAYGGAAVFTNTVNGVFTKTGNSQLQFSGVTFDNAGLVDVQNGSLYFVSGGSAAAGAVLRTAADTALYLGNYTVNDGVVFQGGGAFVLLGNSTLLGTVNAADLRQSGGTLSGDHTLASGTHFTWNGGNFNSSGTTTIAAGATFAIGDGFTADYAGRTFVNYGEVTHVNANNLSVRGGAGSGITNHGTWTENTSTYEGHYNNAYGGAPVFTNTASGAFVKTGNSQVRFSGVHFANAGLVDAQAGSIYFASSVSASDGARFRAVGGSIYFNNLTATGTTHFEGVDNYLYVGTHTLERFDGQATWLLGNFNNGDTTTIAPGGTFVISGGFTADYAGHTFVNQGVVNHTDNTNSSLRGGSGSLIRNQGAWNEASSTYTNFINNAYGGSSRFENESGGVFTKRGNATTQFSGVTFTNAGSVVVESGNLAFDSTYRQTGGVTTLAGGSLQAPLLSIGGGSLAGSGPVYGSVTFDPAAETPALLSPGASPGALSISGNLTLNGFTTVRIELGGLTAGTNFDTLSVGGSVSLGDATLDLVALPSLAGSGMTNGTRFEILTVTGLASISGTFAGLAEGATIETGGYAFSISYLGGNGNDIELTSLGVIPEPAACAGLAGILALGFGACRRRRYV